MLGWMVSGSVSSYAPQPRSVTFSGTSWSLGTVLELGGQVSLGVLHRGDFTDKGSRAQGNLCFVAFSYFLATTTRNLTNDGIGYHAWYQSTQWPIHWTRKLRHTSLSPVPGAYGPLHYCSFPLSPLITLNPTSHSEPWVT